MYNVYLLTKGVGFVNVAIIGGGASGLISAIEIKSENPKVNVTVFEKLSKAGKKLLATGNGRCNFTNENLSPVNFYGDKAFLKSILTSVHADTENYFRSLGILAYREDGRIYPRSQQASAVRDALVNKAIALGVEFIYDSKIEKINTLNYKFQIDSHTFDCVLITTGGKASPVHGSDGSGYKIAEDFGHTLTPLYPALCGLVPEEKLSILKGVRAECKASLYSGNVLLGEESGEIQFTDKGISGIPVMNLSHLCKDYKNLKLILNLCEDISETELREHINMSDKNLETEELLNGIINSKLGFKVMDYAGIKAHTKLADISKRQIDYLIDALFNLEIPIKCTRDFDNAQITCGGVDTKEINPKTMMSEIKNGLFFAGEILDIHGDCGGYNLHLAFTTGRIAAEGIINYLG